MNITHTLYPALVGRPIHVAVAGCGGNGSQMLSGLARMDLSLRALGHPGLEVVAHDPDVVTEANLGRQLFSPGDVGRNKADVLVNRLNCFFGLNWQANSNKFNGGQCDILIGCVDSIASRRALSCFNPYYWLDLGNTDRTGQVILGAAKQYRSGFTRARIKAGKPTKREAADLAAEVHRPLNFFELFPHLRKVEQEDNAPSCSLAGALERQDLFINQAVTTWALHLLWQLLRHGHVTCNGYFINLNTGLTRPIPLPTTPLRKKQKRKARR
jgi:PRTRC genetic system ThiF family protein